MNKSSLFQASWNFLGLPDELAQPDRAKAWVLPVPYEATTSYEAGTRNGPAAIIAASRPIERFDREVGGEPALEFGIHTLPPLKVIHTAPGAMEDNVAEAVAGILSGSPSPDLLAVLGGEHSISPGVARGIARALPRSDLVAVHIDAHGDLAAEYDGTPFSHACAARRILDTCPIFQVGIRSLSADEDRFIRGCKRLHTVFGEDAVPGGTWLKDLARFVKGKTVYLTIDVDGLDPSIMPAVGTPEPGGISWDLTLEIVRIVCRGAASFPVFDLVELAPIPGMTAPNYLCARLVYKIMALALSGRRPRGRKGSR